METKFVEVTNGPRNWGKFLLGRFTDEEWNMRSAIGGMHVRLLPSIGWARDHIWVMDLQTCEAVGVSIGGSAHADLNKHKVWVCPMFEPFLEWLYKQKLPLDFSKIPAHVDLPDAEFAMHGYRREGSAS